MHSKIYQVSQTPIIADEYIDESRYYDNFVGSIADYVDPLTEEERRDAIRTLADILGAAAVFDGDKFTIVDKLAFFKPRYETWKRLIDRLGQATLEMFAFEEPLEGEGKVTILNSLSGTHYMAEEAYSNKYGYYFDDNGEEYGNQRFNDFMRHASNGDVFYIGAVIDYHA